MKAPRALVRRPVHKECRPAKTQTFRSTQRHGGCLEGHQLASAASGHGDRRASAGTHHLVTVATRATRPAPCDTDKDGMCGVIGYVGRREAKERLLRALERLEYRGYDSAGICLIGAGGLESIKAVGKLEHLKRKAAGVASRSTAGIGHTRWATHGRVTEQNAHPLRAGEHDDVAIVLNGIIENHGEIKQKPDRRRRALRLGD